MMTYKDTVNFFAFYALRDSTISSDDLARFLAKLHGISDDALIFEGILQLDEAQSRQALAETFVREKGSEYSLFAPKLKNLTHESVNEILSSDLTSSIRKKDGELTLDIALSKDLQALIDKIATW